MYLNSFFFVYASGNVHVLLFFDAKDQDQMKEAKSAAAEMVLTSKFKDKS
jgi:hypothetical protein